MKRLASEVVKDSQSYTNVNQLLVAFRINVQQNVL